MGAKRRFTKSSTKNLSFRFFTLLCCALAMASGAGLYLYKMELLGFARRPAKERGDAVVVVIGRGSTAQSVAHILYNKGIISDERRFYNWLHFVAKQEKTLKAGTYELSPGMSPEEILSTLQTGRRPEQRFTVPEGLRNTQVAAIISDAGFGSKEDILSLLNSADLAREFNTPDVGVEGYLFPDTYQFPRGTAPLQVLRRMRAHLDEVIDGRLRKRMLQLGWTLHKTLTLAAIIEKETSADDERAHVSSVFHNRLKRGMRLQTDPTVIYGTPDYDGNIRKSDLLRDHPYNTYLIAGLPPGPICQPGEAAIEAALFPSDDDDLYFVAIADSGRHRFCADLRCHKAAVKQWRLYRKNNP